MPEPNPENEDRDDLARRAAMVLFRSPEVSFEAALAAARRDRGSSNPVSMPGRGLVHRHLEAMLQEALGQAGFEASRRKRLAGIIEVLDLLEYLAGPDAIDVAGRTAQGFLEGPLLVFTRLYGGAELASLAGELEASGIEEVACVTAHTRHGPLPRIIFSSDGIRFLVTRCPRALHAQRDRSLFSDRVVAVRSLAGLRTLGHA